MKVVICGAGQVGFSIARYLSQQDNDITVIDQSESIVSHLADTLDVRAVVGHASHPEVLVKAGIAEADMIVGVTYSDEVNMVACQIAYSLFGVPLKIARVRSKSYLEPQWSNLYRADHMPIDHIISPEIEVAKAIGRSLEIPGAFEVLEFGDGTFIFMGMRARATSPIVNTPLRLIGGLFRNLDLSIMGIVRGERFFVPNDSDRIEMEDEVYCLVPKDQIANAVEAFGYTEQRSTRLLILGGGNVGLCLAQEVEANHTAITTMMIERDITRASLVANQLNRTVVLSGDALDREILKEANAQVTNIVVAVTDDDKVNILAALLAKRLGAHSVTSLVNSLSYSSLVTSLGIDAVISPKALTVSSILQYVRRGRIRSVHSIREGYGEVIEAEAVGTSSVVGMSISEINVPGTMIVSGILRGIENVVPRPETIIKVNDRLIVMVTSEGVKKFEKLFSVRLGYF
ncbi:Trk system potassium uptake protein TrkA [Candidatus Bealeia paramacronuclearis]|uniref:Trk system potassium uptake protein TrkA n=1 Tax=Candidatus Bealeia paramacronuclearis TaxID=1921001 RepID=A0ABZ2C1U9_9PROT|nr:Trk system potassium uptake protein TrkA [Candidatus Bealeia paramacronuclearis]